VFDTMGQGDVDGDKYYVLKHPDLFEALVGSAQVLLCCRQIPFDVSVFLTNAVEQGEAHDYASQSFERPRHRESPCSPTRGHDDANLGGAFAMFERLTDRRGGGGLVSTTQAARPKTAGACAL
jgi:hypothetical protein